MTRPNKKLFNLIEYKALLVWLISATFFLYEFFLRTVMGTYQMPIMEELNLSYLQFTILSSTIFMGVYGLMQIPVGIIVDNIGLKKSLFLASIICAIANFAFAYTNTYNLAMLSRILMGFGASFGFVCMLITVSEWLPKKYIGVFIGVSQFIGTLGPMLAAGPMHNLSAQGNTTWRQVFIVLGIVGATIALLSILYVENNKNQNDGYTILYKPEKILTTINQLFARWQPWGIGITAASLYFAVEYFAENEGVSFLVLNGLSSKSASYTITLSWLGYAIGCPTIGIISDLLERRKLIIATCTIVNVICIVNLVYFPNKALLPVWFFILGFAASGQSICFANMAEQFSKKFIAIGFGLNNFAITTLAASNAPIVALLLDKVKGNNTLPNMTHYKYAFVVLLIMAVIGAVLAIFTIKETFCKSNVELTKLKVT